MTCPECGSATSVLDSRPYQNGQTIRRRRICPNGHRATSYEMYKDENIQERVAGLENAIDSLRALALASFDSTSNHKQRWRAACELLGVDYSAVCLAVGVSASYLSHGEGFVGPKPELREVFERNLSALIWERLNPNPSKLEEVSV